MSTLKKNFAYNMAYQILVIILPLITTPYISRVLGAEGIGTYSYLYSIAYYFGMFGMLGISSHGNRSIALVKGDKNRISETFWEIYSVQLITTIISLIVYIFYLKFFFKGNMQIAIIDILFILSHVLDVSWFFFGLEKFKLTVTRNTILKLFTVLFIFLLVKDKNDLWLYTLIMAMGTFLSQAYLWSRLKKYISLKKVCYKSIKQHIKPILILFIPVIAYSIYKVMDKIMLGAMSDVIQVGYYENSEKIIGVPQGIITAFGTVMMPRITTLLSNDKTEKITEYNKLSFKYFSLIVFGMVFGLIGISDVLPTVYFGKEFESCSALITGLSISLIFVTWANIIRTQYLIPNKTDMPYVISTIFGAVINLFLNLIFIPFYGAMGALIGTVAAEFMVFFVQAMYVRKKFFVFKYLRKTIVFIPIGMVMCISVYCLGFALGKSITTLIIQVLLGIFVYGVLSLVYLLTTKDTLALNLINQIKNKAR